MVAAENPLQTESITGPQYHDALTTFDGTFGSRWYPATSAAREQFTDSSVTQLVFDKDGSGIFIVVTDPKQHSEVHVEFRWRLEESRLTLSVPETPSGERALPVKSGTYTISLQRVVKGLPALDVPDAMAQAFYLLTFDTLPVASSDAEYSKQWLRPLAASEAR
jgi:hypothetical protein